MLNDEDINKLKSVFATKEDFGDLATKSDFNLLKSEVSEIKSEMDRGFNLMAKKSDVEEIKSDLGDLKELVQALIVSSDSIAKSISDLTMEYAAISSQLSRHDRWIKQIAEKVGLSLQEA